MLHTQGSFRDPSGFLFVEQGVLYRQVNRVFQESYEKLLGSGLYAELTSAGLLLEHTEAGLDLARGPEAYRILKPEQLGFISYPYEWCFGQLKDAALLTLDVQARALARGMMLRDASAYNVQYVGGRPKLIDTLSLGIYEEGSPWQAYRQFAQHFLAPLALMSRRDVSLGQLLRVHIDGIPLDLASKLLPYRTRFDLSLQLHVHLHARLQRRYASRPGLGTMSRRRMGPAALRNFIEGLRSAVSKLVWEPKGTVWGDYYQGDSYDPDGLHHKQVLVSDFLTRVSPRALWDLGANTGLHSRIASRLGIATVAWDVDPAAVELNYRQVVRDRETNLLPLVLDLANPSGAIGWANEERMSLLERGPVDAAMALALIHHLAIGNNLPFERIAGFLARLARHLIIEFVPKEDPKVQHLLASREDVFPAYAQPRFEAAFGSFFRILASEPIRKSSRILYLMERRDGESG